MSNFDTPQEHGDGGSGDKSTVKNYTHEVQITGISTYKTKKSLNWLKSDNIINMGPWF